MYPIVPISLGPYLSTAIPVNGPKMREVRTMGVNSSPVCKAVNPKTDCDCVGIVASKTARMVFSAGFTFGPVLAGSLRESIGYGNMNAVVAGMCAVVAALCFGYLGGAPRCMSRK